MAFSWLESKNDLPNAVAWFGLAYDRLLLLAIAIARRDSALEAIVSACIISCSRANGTIYLWIRFKEWIPSKHCMQYFYRRLDIEAKHGEGIMIPKKMGNTKIERHK
jgi:hypothetical protein